MVSVLEKKIHARSPQRLEELVHEPRIDGGLDDRERTGEEEFTLGVCSEKANTPNRGRVRALAAMVEPGKIVDWRRPVDAYGHAGTCFGKEIEQLLAEKRSVGLDTDGMAMRSQMSPQATKKCSELIEAQQQRFPSVENDREARLLPSGVFDQSLAESLHDLAMHAFGLKAPRGVRPAVHVAVGAVDIAPTRGLDENRVQPAGGRRIAVDHGKDYRPRLCRLWTRS